MAGRRERVRRGLAGWLRRGGVFVAAAALAAGCALRPPVAQPPVTGRVETGIASWYGPGFHGRRTSSGEIYDQFELTAAHPALPLGTRVAVTNLANGRTVQVRINDRGPFVKGRVIDLSYAAARSIGLVGPGTARVRIEVLGPEVRRHLAAPRYSVQVGAFADRGRADRLRARLAVHFPDARVSTSTGPRGTYYRVRVGPYPLRGLAAARASTVAALGYPAIIAIEE